MNIHIKFSLWTNLNWIETECKTSNEKCDRKEDRPEKFITNLILVYSLTN